MNLYLSLGRIWTGTQADARAAQGGKDFVAIDVPTDKAGLLAFLNTLPGPPVAVPTVADDAFLSAVMGMSPPYRNGDPTLLINGSRDPSSRVS